MLEYFIVVFLLTLAFCFCYSISRVFCDLCCSSDNNAEVRNGESNQSRTPGVMYVNQDVPEIRFTPWYFTEEQEVESPSMLLLSENAQPE